MFDSVGVAYNLYKQEAPAELHDVLKLFSINTQLLPELNLMTSNVKFLSGRLNHPQFAATSVLGFMIPIVKPEASMLVAF